MGKGIYLTHEYGGIFGINNGEPFDFKLSFESTDAIDWEIYGEEDNWNLYNTMTKEDFNTYSIKQIKTLKENIIIDDLELVDDFVENVLSKTDAFIGVSGDITIFKDKLIKIKTKRFGL